MIEGALRAERRILEEHQQLREGDPIRLHAEMPPLSVAIVDEPRTPVILGSPGGDDDAVAISTSWALLLLEQSNGTTRLLSRTRYHHGDGLRASLMGGPLLIEPISFVMERKVLEVIKALVERTVPEAAAPAGASVGVHSPS